MEGQVDRRDAERPVRSVVEARRQRVGDRMADDAVDRGGLGQVGQVEVFDQLLEAQLARSAGAAAERAVDERRPEKRRHHPRPGADLAGRERGEVGPPQRLEERQRGQLVARLGGVRDHLVVAGRGAGQRGEPVLQLGERRRRTVPGDQPLGRRHLDQEVGLEVAVGLEVDQVVARRGRRQPFFRACLPPSKAPPSLRLRRV